jgi:hypothetical protein
VAQLAKVMKVMRVMKGATTASHAEALAVGCAAAPKESTTLTTARARLIAGLAGALDRKPLHEYVSV